MYPKCKAQSIEEFKNSAAYFTGNETHEQTRLRIRRENRIDEKLANGTLKRSSLFNSEATHVQFGEMFITYPPGFFDEGGAWDRERKENEARDRAEMTRLEARARRARFLYNAWIVTILLYTAIYNLLYYGIL